jgi:hypothetical protein
VSVIVVGEAMMVMENTLQLLDNPMILYTFYKRLDLYRVLRLSDHILNKCKLLKSFDIINSLLYYFIKTLKP